MSNENVCTVHLRFKETVTTLSYNSVNLTSGQNDVGAYVNLDRSIALQYMLFSCSLCGGYIGMNLFTTNPPHTTILVLRSPIT